MRARRYWAVPLLLCSSLTGCHLLMHASGGGSVYDYSEFRIVRTSQSAAAQPARAYSPGDWEYGGGVRLAPGFPLGVRQALSAHPMVSYSYLKFDGGSDAVYELGGQLRWRPTPTKRNGGVWLGGEVAGARLSTSVDGGGSSSANGWSLTGLVGMPVGSSRWGVNLYAGAGISDYGASGKNIRAGVDLQPWFLSRSKR